jgi:hypothetical protein
MSDLVRQDAPQLALAEHLQDAFGHRDDAVLRVAPGGEGVGLQIGNGNRSRVGLRPQISQRNTRWARPVERSSNEDTTLLDFSWMGPQSSCELRASEIAAHLVLPHPLPPWVLTKLRGAFSRIL